MSGSVSKRNPSIELYRVLLMFLIVLHHAAYHGLWNHDLGLDAEWPSVYWLLTALTIWHVDGFIAITGWFGTRFSMARFIRLWGGVVFYSIFSVAYGVVSTGHFKTGFFAGGWFGRTYLFFLFLVPFLNAGIEYLHRNGMTSALVVFDVAVVLNWLNPYSKILGIIGAGAGAYTIMTFITLYVNVRLLKLYGVLDKIGKMEVLFSSVIFAAFVVFFKSVLHFNSLYNAPHVMLMAIVSLVFFAKYISVPNWLARIVYAVSPLMFGVFLLHETTTFGRFLYRAPQEWLYERFAWHPILIIMASAIICFVICVLVDGLRRIVCIPISRWIIPYVCRIDQKLGFR